VVKNGVILELYSCRQNLYTSCMQFVCMNETTTIRVDGDAHAILKRVKEDLKEKGITADFSDVIRYLSKEGWHEDK